MITLKRCARAARALRPVLLLALAALGASHARADDAKTLRILSWADYVPAELVAEFKKQTGIQVQVTLSNNEEMISKLRATGGAGFDLAQPSQDRILGAQQEFRIYKPLDTSKVQLEQFEPELLALAKRNTTVDGHLYGLPYVWGTEGLLYNAKRTQIADYRDLCRPELRGRTAVRLKRPPLMAFAFASGKDPFALYNYTKAYAALMEQVGKTLSACKVNFRFFYDNKDQLLNGVRAGEIDAAMVWDSGGWALNRENPDIKFINPHSGAIAWMDTFVLPARGRNDAGAYAWINFVMRPEHAAKIAKSVGNFTAARGAEQLADPRLRAQFSATFPDGFKNLRWYPAIPPGLEEIEGAVLDRIKAAN
ncbi:MAG TPA: extracellular solute-binding protein [Candidatus Dormibacteraeota bacterium]|nr:extracellular solute-binding protein [Candidatus Dormibacteraeota bacterium]